jgi:hypothetical protein
MEMSFREKSAWISLVLIALLLMAFLFNVGRTFHLQLGILVLFVVLEIVLHIAIAIQSPRDARAPKDERERLIDLRATHIAFYVLLSGALLSAFSGFHLGFDRFAVSQCVFYTVVIAELVKFASQVIFFRRGV